MKKQHTYYPMRLINGEFIIDFNKPQTISDKEHKKWSKASMKRAKKFCKAFENAVREYNNENKKCQ